MVWSGLVLGPMVLILYLAPRRWHFLRPLRREFYSPWFAGYAPIFDGGYGYHDAYGGIYRYRNYVRNIHAFAPNQGEPVRTVGGMPRSSQFGVAGPSFRNNGGFRAGGFHGGGFPRQTLGPIAQWAPDQHT
jgi:hypothetical protein